MKKLAKAALFCVLITLSGRGNAEKIVDFSMDVAPILHDQCLICHNENKARGNYRLGKIQQLFEPGESDRWPVVPGRPDESYLWELLVHPDESSRMPQKSDPLPEVSRLAIRRWIEQGASVGDIDKDSSLTSVLPRPVYPQPPMIYPRPYPPESMAFSADGKFLIAGGIHELLVHDLQGSSPPRRIQNLAERIHRISPAGDRGYVLATGSPGLTGELMILSSDLASVSPVARASEGFFSGGISPDQKFLAGADASGRIHLFQWPVTTPIRTINAHADWAMALQFFVDNNEKNISSNGLSLISGGRDRSVKTFRLSDGGLNLNLTGLDQTVLEVIIHPEKTRALVRMPAGNKLMKINLEKEKLDGAIKLPAGISTLHQSESDSGLVLAGCQDGRIFRINEDWDGSELLAHPGNVPLTSLAAHESAGIAAADAEGIIHILDGGSGKSRKTFSNMP